MHLQQPLAISPSEVAAPTFVNAGALGSSGNAITLGQPASPAVNDIWIMVVQTANQALTTPTNATSGTWAEIVAQVGTGTAATAGSVRLCFYWHRWTTTTGNVTVPDSGNHQIARIAAFRGCKTSGNPWNAISAMATGTWTTTTTSQPALTTTVNNTKMVLGIAHSEDIADTTRILQGNGSKITAASGKAFDNTLSTGTGGGIGLTYGVMGTAGTIIPASLDGLFFDLTTNPTNYVICALALEGA